MKSIVLGRQRPNGSHSNGAVALGRACPGLAYGAAVEVRPVAVECPIAEKLQPEAQRRQKP